MKTTTSYTDFSDRELVAGTKRLAFEERRATAALIRSLMELDARRLYLAEGCASLFKYCTDVLRLSEDAAYNRMEIARAARRLPAILDALEEGALTLTSARRLAPHLTEDNCSEVLTAAKFKSKASIEELIATLTPKPDVRAADGGEHLPPLRRTQPLRSRAILRRRLPRYRPGDSPRVAGM